MEIKVTHIVLGLGINLVLTVSQA